MHNSVRVPSREPSALSAVLARNIKKLRFRLGHTPEKLAELAGIDSAAIEQIESAKGEPTLALAWRIASALGVPFSALTADRSPGGTVIVRKDKANMFVSDTLGLASRALLPFEEMSQVEFYELKLAPQHHEASRPHAAGTTEILHIAEGTVEVTVGREPPHVVKKGDTIRFPADLPHGYRNLTPLPATLYLVMTYQ